MIRWYMMEVVREVDYDVYGGKGRHGWDHIVIVFTSKHRRLCRVKNMLAMYLKYHKAGLTPTTPVTSIPISPVKMSIGRKSLTNLHSEMIFLQGKPVFYIFLPSTPPY
jgi:hypothetical protein